VYALVSKALIVGSAPISQQIAPLSLGGYHKIAINKSWRLRRDFDSHIALQSLPAEDEPPLTETLDRIGVASFTPVLRNAGGLYLTSGSVAMIAGYWSIARLGLHFLSYYGCDLVFDPTVDGRTHFYGAGDAGPLVGNFQYNLRQQERSLRLMCWGLLHNVVILNASALEGTVLAFPKAGLDTETYRLHDDILSSKEAQRLLRKTGNMLADEAKLRTPAFRAKQSVFEDDPEALTAMNKILDGWADLAPSARDFAARCEELIEASEQLKTAGRKQASPSVLLERTRSEYDLALHLGFHKTATTSIQQILEAADDALSAEGCQIVPHKKLRNNYTRLVETFASQAIGIEYGDPLSAEMFQAFSKSFFKSLRFKPGTRVVLSEENALGHVGQCAYPGLLYRFPKQFLSTFATNLPVEPSEIHVAVRDYASFFTSCYVEYLGSVSPERFNPPDVMMAKVMANLPSWHETLDIVRLCFPQSKLHVWCYEDFRTNLPEFLTALTGVPQAKVDWASRVNHQARPTAGAEEVELFFATVSAEGVETALERWKIINEATQSGGVRSARFNPWAPEHEAHLRKLYQRDLQEIAQDPNIILHRATAGSAQTHRKAGMDV